MSFLPEDYEMKESQGNYMKFEQGPNKFRVLTQAITGWEYWVDAQGDVVSRNQQAGEGGKPVRVKTFKQIAGTIPAQYEAKEFWAFVVYNYSADQVQILHLTQKTIMRSLNALNNSDDWGDPKGYDITITRSGEKLETEYSVMPSPKIKFSEDGSRAKEINLEALYEGEDPFALADQDKIKQIKKDVFGDMDEDVDPEEVFEEV